MSFTNGFKKIRRAVHEKEISNGKYHVGRNNKVVVEVFTGGNASLSPEEGLRRVIKWAEEALALLGDKNTPSTLEVRGKIIKLLETGSPRAGYTHPAEELIEEALRTSDPIFIDQILSDSDAETREGFITCLGRIPSAEKPAFPWVTRTLRSSSLGHRYAAAYALENWGSEDALDALRQRLPDEKDKFLAKYISDVLGEWSVPR